MESLNNEQNCHEISEDKMSICKKTACKLTEREGFRFELSVLERVSSCKNISFPRHA